MDMCVSLDNAARVLRLPIQLLAAPGGLIAALKSDCGIPFHRTMPHITFQIIKNNNIIEYKTYYSYKYKYNKLYYNCNKILFFAIITNTLQQIKLISELSLNTNYF